MSRWIVRGCHKDTAKDCRFLVTAQSLSEAEQVARGQGLYISSIELLEDEGDARGRDGTEVPGAKLYRPARNPKSRSPARGRRAVFLAMFAVAALAVIGAVVGVNSLNIGKTSRSSDAAIFIVSGELVARLASGDSRPLRGEIVYLVKSKPHVSPILQIISAESALLEACHAAGATATPDLSYSRYLSWQILIDREELPDVHNLKTLITSLRSGGQLARSRSEIPDGHSGAWLRHARGNMTWPQVFVHAWDSISKELSNQFPADGELRSLVGRQNLLLDHKGRLVDILERSLRDDSVASLVSGASAQFEFTDVPAGQYYLCSIYRYDRQVRAAVWIVPLEVSGDIHVVMHNGNMLVNDRVVRVR